MNRMGYPSHGEVETSFRDRVKQILDKGLLPGGKNTKWDDAVDEAIKLCLDPPSPDQCPECDSKEIEVVDSNVSEDNIMVETVKCDKGHTWKWSWKYLGIIHISEATEK